MVPLSKTAQELQSFRAKHRKPSLDEARNLIANAELFLKCSLQSTSCILTELIAPPNNRRAPQSKTLKISLNSKKQIELSLRCGYRDNPFRNVSKEEAIETIMSLYIHRQS
ncbi:TPA: hypothetical protein I7730_16300 [Vibrio vulnificus]|uniref:Uncharacterized protein n=1 Tax=Vibrio vulnificus TaxID=672 RepID=A0A8H9TGD7_VIBVL|nr:hypothetical protein [Vibrio vulnificus]